MKNFVPALLVIFSLLPCIVIAQYADPVMDSLKMPLPANASILEQISRIETILFYSSDMQYDPVVYSRKLDSLYTCCIAGKTGDLKFEKDIQSKTILFKGGALVYEDPVKSKAIFNEAIKGFYSVGDSAFLSASYMYLCQSASAMGDSVAFYNAYKRSLHFSKYVKDPLILSVIYNNISISCYDFGLYAESTSLNYDILVMIDKYPMPVMTSGRASVYSNIAATYVRLQDFKNAKIHSEKAIQAAKESNQDATDFLGLSGWIYYNFGEYKKALDIFLNIARNKSGQETLNKIASSTYSVARCYRKLGKAKEAIPYAKKGVELLPIHLHSSYGGAAIVELAYCEFETGLVDQALDHALTGFETFTKAVNNLGSVEAAELLVLIYKSRKEFKKALEYSELRFENQQQIERQQSTRQLVFGEFTRENESIKAKREAEVIAQLNKQRNIRYLLFSGLFILSILAYLLFNRFRFKQKSANQLASKNLELETALKRAENSEASKSRFLANMSHEIRTPLHGISGFTELLLETPLAEKQKRWLSSIQDSTDKLNVLVNDILDLSKLEADQVELQFIPFSIKKIVSDVIDSISGRAEEKGIVIEELISAEIEEFYLGDPTRLYQILMNLLGNAMKFTNEGMISVIVMPEEGDSVSSKEKQTILFIIKDTGIGIPANQLDKVFESFQQANADTSRLYGGTGLGLTIVRQLVELYRGEISVQSEVGTGSTFICSLPFVPIHYSINHNKVTNVLARYVTPIVVLIADDNALNREIAKESVLRYFPNANIMEATNGKEVIELVNSNAWFTRDGNYIILMDMQMPEMTGMETTKYIRNTLSGPKQNTPILALTASAMPEEITLALQSGMNGHLGKPFKAKDLAEKIAVLLQLIPESNN